MDKLLTYPGITDKGVFNYLIDYDRNYLVKTASAYHPTIAEYINNTKRIPGVTQVLLTALGAGEYWGDNVNADFFGEDQLAHEGSDYGFKTFEQYAKMYKHHVNKDPNASYGDVLLAVYNPVYHRVELVVGIRHDRARDVVEKIESNEPVFWSMGCLRGDAQVLMSDFTHKRIADIQEGDKIINAGGTVSAVKYPHSHMHVGTWYHIHANGIGDIEPTTEEHPWLVLDKKETECRGKRKCGTCTSRRFLKKNCVSCEYLSHKIVPQWKRADELQIGDHVATPILKGEGKAPEDRYAYLAGIYLANGHVTTAGNRVIISTNLFHKDVYEKIEALYPEFTWVWRPRADSKSADIEATLGYDLCNKLLADCGKYASQKHLSDEVMHWPILSQKVFIGGYLDGDGGCYEGALYLSTCNETLAKQIFHIILRCGAIPCINKIAHKPSNIVKKTTVEYQTWIGVTYAKIFYDYTFKADKTWQPKIIQGRSFIEDGYLWSPIEEIEATPCNETVYNVAIDSGDYDLDSYVVSNVALHNCKIPFDICNICGNKAPTRKHYCEHLRFMLRMMHPETGRKVYAINIRPKFFDISYVLIPADKTALTLKKVAFAHNPGFLLDARGNPIVSSAEAAEKAAGLKSATIEKEVPISPEPASVPIDEAKAKDILRAGMEVRAREPALPNSLIDRLCEMGDLGDIMSTMTSCMIMPKPQEFQRIYLIKINRRDLADRLDGMGACFDPEHLADSDSRYEDMLGLHPSRVNLGMANLLAPHFEDRSNFGPHLVKRMTIMVKEGSSYPEGRRPLFYTPELPPREVQNSSEMSPAAVLGIGALLYAALSKGGMHTPLSSLGALASKHPLIATGLGVALLSKLTEEDDPNETYKGRFISGQHRFPDYASPYERVEAMREKPYIKVGAELPARRWGAAARRLALGIPAVQMGSSYLQKRHEMSPGEDEGRVTKFIRKHPNLLSAALAADALLATQGKGTIAYTRHVGDAYHSWLKGEHLKSAAGIVGEESHPSVKAASVQDYLSSSLIWPTVLSAGNLPGRMVGSLVDQAAIDLGSRLIDKSKKQKAKDLHNVQ